MKELITSKQIIGKIIEKKEIEYNQLYSYIIKIEKSPGADYENSIIEVKSEKNFNLYRKVEFFVDLDSIIDDGKPERVVGFELYKDWIERIGIKNETFAGVLGALSLFSFLPIIKLIGYFSVGLILSGILVILFSIGFLGDSVSYRPNTKKENFFIFLVLIFLLYLSSFAVKPLDRTLTAIDESGNEIYFSLPDKFSLKDLTEEMNMKIQKEEEFIKNIISIKTTKISKKEIFFVVKSGDEERIFVLKNDDLYEDIIKGRYTINEKLKSKLKILIKEKFQYEF